MKICMMNNTEERNYEYMVENFDVYIINDCYKYQTP